MYGGTIRGSSGSVKFEFSAYQYVGAMIAPHRPRFPQTAMPPVMLYDLPRPAHIGPSLAGIGKSD
jgi:hypothetical protein